MHGTTGGDEKQRLDEVSKLLKIVAEFVFKLNEKELAFVNKLKNNIDRYGVMTKISPRELFYLRDIKDRYL